jgi:hypothetical protein
MLVDAPSPTQRGEPEQRVDELAPGLPEWEPDAIYLALRP